MVGIDKAKFKRSDDGVIKTPKDRLLQIEETMLESRKLSLFYFAALKSQLPENHRTVDVQNMRNMVLLIAEAMGFEYGDVMEEIALFQLRKMAFKQLLDEIGNEQRATLAIAKSGKTIKDSLDYIKTYGNLRLGKAVVIDPDALDTKLEELPF